MAALFLKYRPQTFSDLVGQTSVVRTLQNALKIGKPSHAYLFAGSRGTGKTSMARIFAKGLICQNLQDGDPCGKCEFCNDILRGSLVDVIEIDAASNRGIDEIRDLREKIRFLPTRATRKIYIIDEVHMLTKEAFNALLKTLEEPPDHAFFLLATTEMHKLPETIISRCQTFVFHRFGLEQLTTKLAAIAKTENFITTPEALELIARKAEGGLRDAISLLEQIAAEMEQNITAQSVRESLGISETQVLEEFWNALCEKNMSAALAALKDISHKGKDARTFGHDFLGFLREQMYQNTERPEALSAIVMAIEEVEVALGRLKTSPIVDLPLEIAVVNLCQKGVAKLVSPTGKVESAPTTQKSEKKQIAPAQSQSVKEVAKSESASSGFIFENESAPTPAIQEVRQHKKIESVPCTDETVSLSRDTVISKMSEIAERAHITSAAKQSFLSSRPEIAEGKIIFRTESSFHLATIKTENIRTSVQNAMIEIFKQKVLIEFGKSNGNGNGNGHTEAKKPEVATVADLLQF